MEYTSRFKLGKEYIVLNAEASAALQVGKDLNSDYVEKNSFKVSFDELITVITRFENDLAQYVVGCSGIRTLKQMDFFGFNGRDERESFSKVEDIVVFSDYEQIADTTQFVKENVNVRLKNMFLFDDNEGEVIQLPDTIGTMKDDSMVIAGYKIREIDGCDVLISDILLPKEQWEHFTSEASYTDDEFHTFSKYFM